MTHPFPHRRAAQCYAEKDDVQPRTSLSPCSAGLAVIRAPRLATSGPAEDVVEDAFDAERLIGVEENVEVLTGDGGFLRVHYPEDSVNFGSADDETPLDGAAFYAPSGKSKASCLHYRVRFPSDFEFAKGEIG